MRMIRLPLPARSLAAATAVCLVAGGTLAASAAAAPKPKHEVTTLSISNKLIAVKKHHVDSITGVLRVHIGRAHDMVVPGKSITLEARAGVTPRWAAVGTSTTGVNGAVTFAVAPKVKTQYKLVFAGAPPLRASASNVVTVRPVK